MKTLFILFISVFIIGGLFIGFKALAQEQNVSDSATEQEVAVDEDVTAADLGIKDPTILPNSPFYFLKNFQRQLRLALTFNQVKKAELRLQFANEMLVEAQKLAEKTGNQELFQRAIDKYQKQIEKIQNQVEKFKNNDKDDIKIDSFADRFNKKIELHQQIMEKLQEKLATGSQSFESVQKAQQKVIQHLNQVGEKLQERFQNREKKCENLCGDNQCQEIVCQAIGCPCAETKATCPEDCK